MSNKTLVWDGKPSFFCFVCPIENTKCRKYRSVCFSCALHVFLCVSVFLSFILCFVYLFGYSS